VLNSLKKRNQVLMLQFSDLRVDQRREPCIRVNIRELNRELCTGLSTLYIKSPWFMLYVVATTRLMSNESTINKSQSRYLVGNMSCIIHKRAQKGTTTVFY